MLEGLLVLPFLAEPVVFGGACWSVGSFVFKFWEDLGGGFWGGGVGADQPVVEGALN